MTEAQLSQKREVEEDDVHLEAFLCRFDDEDTYGVSNMDAFQNQQLPHLGPICLPAPPTSPLLPPLLYTPLPSPTDQASWGNEITVTEPIQEEKEDFDNGLWTRNANITGFSNSSSSSFSSLLRNKQQSFTINGNSKEKEKKEKSRVAPFDNRVYKLQFKQCYKYYIIKKSSNIYKQLSIGEFVKVEADRGEDLGIVCAVHRYDSFVETKPTAGFRGRGSSAIVEDSKYILRRATNKERQELPIKLMEENKALMVCREKVASRGYQMVIKDAEYQFDRHKLSFYYEADRRIDFRCVLIMLLYDFYHL